VGRINLDELKEEDETRNKNYVWEKPLIIGGRTISTPKPKINKEKEA
jgi:hypothetical protein